MTAPTHRASDGEREATADRLRVAAGDGRLDPGELEERLDAAYSARTVADLEALTEDLPAPLPAERGRRRLSESPEVRARLASFIVCNTVCIAIWAATGASGSFWPVWVLLGTGIGLFAKVVRRALGVEEREALPRAPEPPARAGLPGSPQR